jgi:replication factor C subunit 1
MSFNNDELWINKYKPTKINHLIGNKEEIVKLEYVLQNIHTSKSHAIIISGVQGIGKKKTIKLILEKLGYNIWIIKPNDIKDYRIFDDFNDYYNHQNSIYNKINFTTPKNKKIALIFDEMENITLTTEKKYVMDIYKENSKLKSFPLIFISNNQHSKLLNDLKKNCHEIVFKIPSYNEIYNLVNHIIKNENLIFESDSIHEKLIEFSQYDIRRLINLLQELSYHAENNTITNKKMSEFIDKSKIKHTNIGLFDSTKRLLNYYLDYETIIKLYESEKVLLPLMIHENYIRMLSNNNNKEDNIDSVIKILDSMSQGDNIETSIYTDQNWYLQNIHGFYTCINTSYHINKTKTNAINIKDIKFSSDLNKTSLKNINRKNIFNLSKVVNNKSIFELLMLNRICNNMIEDKNINKLLNILTKYQRDLSIKEVELCLKIDKSVEFNILGSKEKKQITKKIKSIYEQ